jgi:isoleucyl-tRNA synthetase
MDLSLKPNFKAAGPALGGKIKAFGAAIAKLDPKEAAAALDKEGRIELELDGEIFSAEEDLFEVRITAKPGFAVAMGDSVFVILDTTITPELKSEGIAREMISKVQQLRKQKDFEVTDRIRINYRGDDIFKRALEEHRDYIMSETLAQELKETEDPLTGYDLNGHKTGIDVERLHRQEI